MTGEDDSSAGSEAGAISVGGRNSGCTEEMAEVCWPVGRRMAGATAEEMGEETVEETVCIADTAGSAEYMPGHQRLDPAGENTSASVNGGCKPLYQRLKVCG